MKYKSEIIHEILEQRGHEKSSLHYQSECVETWVDEAKGGYPKLCDYESEWLNYINENPIGEFPYETVTTNSTATVNNVVPFAYKSAILKGQTLVNIFDVALPTEIKNNHVITLPYQVNANETYTFIVEAESTSEKYQGGFITTNGEGNGWNGSVDNGISKFTVTTSEATNKVKFSAIGASNTVQIKKCMIIKGDYSNQDIPFFTGMQSVKMPVLTTTGKNLYNPYLSKKLISLTKNEFNLASYSTTKDAIISLKPNTKYKVIFKPNGSAEITNEYVFFGFKLDNKGMSGLGGDVTFYRVKRNDTPELKETEITTDNTGNLYMFRFDYAGADGYINDVNLVLQNIDIHIEESSTYTEYEPYKSNILTVNEDVTLRGIGDVQDTLDCLTGEVTERIGEIVLDGSENWGTLKEGRYCIENTLNNINRPHLENINFKCDKLKAVSYSEEYSGTLGISLYPGTNYDFVVRTDIQAIEEFKQWLSNNPTTVQYLLATESIKTVDLTITNQDGETLNNLKPIEGTMHITTGGNLIKPTFTAEIPVEAITQNLNSFIEEE